MGDLAAAEGQAQAEAEAEAGMDGGPRFSVTLGAMMGFLGSTVLSSLTALLLATRTPVVMPILVGVGLAYALALLVWAGLWRRPLAVAAVLGASLAGLACGFVVGLLLLWMAVPGSRPNLVPA